MINVLIYSEPIIFLEQVEKNSGLLSHLAYSLINPLNNCQNNKYKIYLICNEFQFLDKQITCDVELIRMTQRELTNGYRYKPFELMEQWQTGLYSDEILEYYCDLFSKKIKFKPDIIFTIFRTPFLEKLFKNTLILGSSVGIVSRPPFPHTLSYVIGDLGRCFDCYTSEYWKSIKYKHQLSEKNKILLGKLKTKVKEILNKNNPYKEILNEFRKKYKYLYLIPFTQPFDMYLSKQRIYNSYFPLLLDVLDNTPENVGIIVTTHPRLLNYLDEEMIASLKKKYGHFLHDPLFNKYLSTSQFLLPEIDGVISLGSSVSLQTMFFDKKIITLGETFLDCIRDTSTLKEFAMTLDTPAANKDDMLFWYLTRYCPTSKYYLDSEWLDKFLMRSLEKYKNKDFENFYELIDEPSVIINHLIESLDENIPYRANNISDFTKENIINLQNNIPIQYNREFRFNLGSFDVIYLREGFSKPEQDQIWTNKNTAEIEFPVTINKNDVKLIIKGVTLTPLQIVDIAINDINHGKIENGIGEIIIKANELTGKYLNIKLIMSKLYSPKELGMNDDTRELGFALTSIGLNEYL